MHQKPNLPQKTCESCSLAFSWRRKWAKNWPDVKYCSQRCRMQRGKDSRRT
ncbi:MAG: DUF2256 domain-containing protein [Gammaproteobacteria bacterium]|nr:DUF2256 domain-containing protein [Gammaproteobacteria bacterium]